MTEGIIFDIKRYAIHDGPGIRTTVFMKGCPLNCLWCHNPEGKSPEPELIYFPKKCRETCRLCIEACPENALSKNGTVKFDQSRCRRCGTCADACVYEALELAGNTKTAEEVVGEVRKDKIFFDESGGGVTFSGGEPLMQPEFLEDMLDRFKQLGIHTAVDSCGYAPSDVIERIARKADLFLFDIKIIDEKKHKKYTGVSNELIIENLNKLLNMKCAVWIRIPLIAGINDGPDDIKAIAAYLSSLKPIERVSLLPYHRAGTGKEDKLQKNLRVSAKNIFQAPSPERRAEIAAEFSNSGLKVKEGG
ncbi:MAG: glycyl-radical enzyme activating protein [Candidatus Aminicenantes bacterium]|nr:glycyl-radical enzyme activating protein [Candidatus Aminicenantes bacterium]